MSAPPQRRRPGRHGEREKAALPDRVDGRSLGAQEHPGAQHVDDGRAEDAATQVRERVLREEDGAAQVDVQGFGPRLGGVLADGLHEGVGRIVDDDVDVAEPLDRPANGGMHFAFAVREFAASAP
jgi:hypothetical protein